MLCSFFLLLKCARYPHPCFALLLYCFSFTAFRMVRWTKKENVYNGYLLKEDFFVYKGVSRFSLFSQKAWRCFFATTTTKHGDSLRCYNYKSMGDFFFATRILQKHEITIGLYYHKKDKMSFTPQLLFLFNIVIAMKLKNKKRYHEMYKMS
jgi:hypothetical protein